MPAPTLGPTAGAGRRTLALALLAVVVLALHTLALRGPFAPAALRPSAPPTLVQPLDTRLIAAAPVAAPPVRPAAESSPARERKPQPPQEPLKFKKKPAETLSERPQEAPDLIAPDTASAVVTTPPDLPSAGTAPSSEPSAESSAAAPGAATDAPQAAAPPAGLQTTPITAMALPPSVQLNYRMTGSAGGMAYQASAQLDWRNAGSHYDSRISVSAFLLGSRSLESRGEIDAGGLAPLRFADNSRKREQAAHFEPAKKQITFSSNAPPAVWLAGAQDRLSVFMQLSGMLAGNPAAFALGTRIAIYTAGPRGAELWTFLVEAEELLQVPLGELVALKLTSQLRNEYDRRLEIWYAPSLGYLPARFRYTQVNQDFIDQQLREVKPL